MADLAGSRRLVALSVNPTEYFVRGEGSESDVRSVVAKLLPNAEFELSAIDDRTASGIESRLQPPQQELLKNLAAQGGTQPLKSYRVKFKTAPTANELSEDQLASVTGGALASSPLGAFVAAGVLNLGPWSRQPVRGVWRS